VGTAYAQTLTASLGNPPYTWKLVVGSGSLPKGVKLGRTTGALTGTPRASGTFSFAVEVLDARSASKVHTQTVATQALSLTVT
jgi:hypothetical protein